MHIRRQNFGITILKDKENSPMAQSAISVASTLKKSMASKKLISVPKHSEI